MLFSSMVFLWVFLPLCLAGYYLIDDRYKNVFLLAASLLFYAWGEPKNILLIIFSILINYCLGVIIEDAPLKKAKFFTICGIVFDLGMLGLFKYTDFAIDSVNAIFGTSIANASIALPIGISFYTFQSLSYVIDVYRTKTGNNPDNTHAQKNLLKLALYISFFPQLIAGPIVKYHDIELQLSAPKAFDIGHVTYGIKRFAYGLAKKMLLSNTFAAVADRIFALGSSELSCSTAWLGAICYLLQIYYDFSGYSDMAIGLGKIFGFDFLENFNYPYTSGSIQEFWRRWHISLSTWFKEYLYIPLGGNRKGKARTYLNLFIVFLATGLWHGANWTFVLWGLFHGLFSIIERLFLGKWLKKLEEKKLGFIGHIYCIFVVIIGWVLFRADTLSQAWSYLGAMFTGGSGITFLYYASPFVLIMLVIGIALCGPVQRIFPRFANAVITRDAMKTWQMLTILVLLLLCSVQLISGSYNPFIYFRF